jgi:hypothetical protein
MTELLKNYENTKKQAKIYMKTGQINAYFNTLLQLNNYEKLLIKVQAN